MKEHLKCMAATTVQFRSRLANQVRQGVPNKRANPFSWEGLEEERERIHQLAEQVVVTDRIADSVAQQRGLYTAGSICSAIRDPNLVLFFPEALEAANAHLALSALHSHLVWDKGLNFDFVRGEYATILNPCDEEMMLCEKNIAREKKKRRRY